MNDAESAKSAIPEKPARHDTLKTLFKFSLGPRSNIRLVIAVLLSVFLCEALVMLAIHPLYHLSPW